MLSRFRLQLVLKVSGKLEACGVAVLGLRWAILRLQTLGGPMAADGATRVTRSDDETRAGLALGLVGTRRRYNV